MHNLRFDFLPKLSSVDAASDSCFETGSAAVALTVQSWLASNSRYSPGPSFLSAGT